MSVSGYSSFSHIPVAAPFNQDIYAKGSRSTQIKGDMLVSYTTLTRIKSQSYDAALAELENVIKVYNENVAYINHSNQNRASYESYKAQFGNEDYNYYTTKFGCDFNFLLRKEEEGQISQLVYLLPDLTAKINRAIERLKIASPNGEMPELTLTPLFRQHRHDLFAPVLRRPVDEPKAPQVIEKTIEVAPAPAAPEIAVTVLCALTSEQTLAICCDPEWGAKPTVFTKSENGWVGEIPVNTDWKFVIIQDGQLTHWEKDINNRCCDAKTPAFTIPAHEIKF